MNFGPSNIHFIVERVASSLDLSCYSINKTAFQLGMQYPLAKLNGDWIIRAKHLKTKNSVTIRSEHNSAVLCADKLICPYVQIW